MSLRDDAIDAGRDYLRQHPDEIQRALRGGLGLRMGVPLAALRWLGEQAVEAGALESLRVDAVPPGLRLELRVKAAATPIGARLDVEIESIRVDADALELAIRLSNVQLWLTQASDTPLADAIRDGKLDLENPGKLFRGLPARPPMIVEAEGDRLVLDLMRAPKIGGDPRVRSALGLLSAFVAPSYLETGDDHLELAFRPLPRGLGGVVGAIGRHVVLPGLDRLLPG